MSILSFFYSMLPVLFQKTPEKSWKTWSSFGISGIPKFLNIKKKRHAEE